MAFWDRFLDQTKKEFTARTRLGAILLESLLFVVLIPYLLILLSKMEYGRINFEFTLGTLLCMVFAIAGLTLGLWAVWAQFSQAHGTPVPLMATKKLLTTGPYALCRNPMALGTMIMYLAIAIMMKSWLAIIAAATFACGLSLFIKLFEEKEMIIRFGQDYLLYKENTPFLIPRLNFDAWRHN